MAELILTEGAAPATPASGKVAVYAKADGLLYSKDDAGVETACGGASFDDSEGDPANVTTAAADGVSTKAARRDHAHALADDVATNAKLANMAQSTIKGRAAGAGTGDPTDLTAAQATAILDNMVGDSGAGGTKGLAPAPAAGDAAAAKFLKADGTWAVPASSLDINSLSAIASELTDSDQLPIYDASVAANKKIAPANYIGMRNYILNGDFSCFRGDPSTGAYFNDNQGTYANGWRFLGESNNSADLFRNASGSNGAKWALRVRISAVNNEKVGLWYSIPNHKVMELRGKQVTLSFWCMVSNTRIGDIRVGVAESTGTADSISADPISAWGSAGTTPTLTSWTFLNTPANLNVTTSWVRYSVTVTVGASANNLGIMIWNDDKTYTSNDYFQLEDVQLEKGPIPTPYERLPEWITNIAMAGRVLQVFLPQDNEPPASSYAMFDTRNSHPVLDFDDAATEAALFGFILPQLFAATRSSNALDVILIWAATSATSGNVVWQASFERVALNGQDIDSDGFASSSIKTDACQGTSGKMSYTKFGAAIANDSLAAGEFGRLKIERVGGNGSDTMSGDAELKAVLIVEPLDVEMALPV